MVGAPITFTATVKPAGLGTPAKNVIFLAGGVQAASVPLFAGVAMYSTSTLPTGTDSITAQYQGNTNFQAGNSSVLPEVVEDFNLVLVPQPGNPSGVTTQTVVPGQSATFDFTVQSTLGPFNFPITLSVARLPPGASVTFNPATFTPNNCPVNITATVQAVSAIAELRMQREMEGGSLALALRLIPFGWRMRKRARQLRNRLNPTLLGLWLLLGIAAVTGMSGLRVG